MMLDPIGVDAATDETMRVLTPYVDADWTVPAGSLEWSCRATAVHLAHDLLAYAGQVAGQPHDAYLALDLTVREDATPAQILAVVAAAGTLLRRAVAGANSGDRGWHWGPTDPGGFAALGVNELLVHTYDIAVGLGSTAWRPPADLASAVLARLFPDDRTPDAPGGEQGEELLWHTGRIALPGRPRRTEWILRAALN